MQVRSSAIRGMPVVEDGTLARIGSVSSPLIHPDTGAIEGFFILADHPEVMGEMFLSSIDILAWGTSIHVRSIDRLAPPDDLIRLRERFLDPRRVLGQTIRVVGSGRRIGWCADVQFDTRRMMIQWLFPRRFFFFRSPVPATDIVEITPEALWIRDPLRDVKESLPTPQAQLSEVLSSRVPESIGA